MIFDQPIQNVVVAFSPDVRMNNRGDVVVMGRAGTKAEVPVIFTGRRAKMVGPLHAMLNKRALASGRGNGPGATVELPAVVQGVWRAQTRRDAEGWEHKTYHLIAATWAMIEEGKALDFQGELPRHLSRSDDLGFG